MDAPEAPRAGQAPGRRSELLSALHRWLRPGGPGRRFLAWVVGIPLFFVVLDNVYPIPFGVGVQGALIGGLSAFTALGIVLIYRTSRVINFAQADMGLIPATIGIILFTQKQWSYTEAVPAMIVIAAGLGYLIERIVIRRFANAPRLILMVATIGLAQILVGLRPHVSEWFGLAFNPSRFPPPILFNEEITPMVFFGNHLIAGVAVVGTVIGLVVLLRFTKMGLGIRAVATNAERASLLGVPVPSISSLVWMIATVLSALGVFLYAGIFSIPDSAAGPSIMLRALVAAVIGRMEGLLATFLAALGIGILEQAMLWNNSSASEIVDPLLFLIVLAALLLQRRRRDTRAEEEVANRWQDTDAVRPVPRELAHLREVKWAPRLIALALVAFFAILPHFLDIVNTNLAAVLLIYAMVAVSLVLLTGWAGEVSLGQMAFVAIGAATSAGLTYHYNWDLTLAVLSAGAVGAVAALIIGFPALRISSAFVAVVTLAFAVATSSYLIVGQRIAWVPSIFEAVPRLPLFGRFDTTSELTFYYVCLSGLLIVLWWAYGLQRARTKRVLVATRENPRAAQSFGVNVIRTRLMAFAVGGFFAAFAGGLLSIHQRAVGQEIYDAGESLRVLTMAVVGGLGSIPGALLGTLFLQSTEWFSDVFSARLQGAFTFIASGAGLLYVLYAVPGGFGSLLYRMRDHYLTRVAERRGIHVTSMMGEAQPAPEVIPSAPPSEPARDGAGRVAASLASREWPDDPRDDAFALPAGVAIAGRDNGGAVPLLSAKGVRVAYGTVNVLFDVSLDVHKGELVALLGTNGAGKSTLLRAMSGLVPTSSGAVLFDGRRLDALPPHKIAAAGVVHVPSGRAVFGSLSVADNFKIAGWRYGLQRRRRRAATRDVLDLFPVLRDKWHSPAADLSGGQRQMLAVGMALMLKPRVLMIDELSLGLAPTAIGPLLDVLRGLREQGTTIVIVEQSVNLALVIAETAYFMEKGQIRYRGPTRELLDRPDILRSVFLENAAHEASEREPVPARPDPVAGDDEIRWGPKFSKTDAQSSTPVVLETQGLTKSFSGVRAVVDVSIELHEGEILGIIGPNGAGKTTLFDMISGFLRPDHGRIVFQGSDIVRLGPSARSHRGLARSFQDGQLFRTLTVHQSVLVALDRRLRFKDPISGALHLPPAARSERKIETRADELLSMFNLQGFRDRFVSELSTGSRRIVDLACQIATEPRVILLDEPSSGINQRETEALAPVLLRLREQTGASLLVIEHDMGLITAISDRLVALELGRFVVDGDPATVLDDPRVVESYLGTAPELIARSGEAPIDRDVRHFRRGDVWLIEFGDPMGRERAGLRPGVIVSVGPRANGDSGLLLVVPMTTTPGMLASHVEIPAGAAALTETSWATCEEVRSVSERRLVERIGATHGNVLARIDRSIRAVLDAR